MTCISFLLYQSVGLFIEFMSGKTVINISVEEIRNTSLPGITICPNFLDLRKLSLLNTNVSILYKQYLKMIKNVNKSRITDMQKYLYNYYLTVLNYYFDSIQQNINIKDILYTFTPFRNQMKEKMLEATFYYPYAYGKIDDDLIETEVELDKIYKMISFPMESIMMDRIFIFTKCYTLFSHLESSWIDIKMVFAYIIIQLKLDDHSFPIFPLFNMRIVMHSADTLPLVRFSFVNPEYFYVIKYSKWNIKRLGKGYDTDCRDYDSTINTRSDCIFDCYQDKLKNVCQTEDIIKFYILKKKIYFDQINLKLSKCVINEKLEYETLEYCYGQCNKE